MISPRIFENKTLYALVVDRIKFGWRADGGVAMVRNDRTDVYTPIPLLCDFILIAIIMVMVLRIDLFRDLRA
jgi:hypothetical protein